MAPDENAHIIVNPSAAGTDWEDFWCGRKCLYSSKSGAAGTEWKERAPQAQIGSGGVEGSAGASRGRQGTSHAASKVILHCGTCHARALHEKEPRI